MPLDKVLYTDGRGITVTDSTFQVNKTSYQLNGIIKHGLLIIRPERSPGMLMLIVGFIVLVIGMLSLIPVSIVPNMEINGEHVTANTVAMWAGGAIALIGILVLVIVRERYAVRIATAEGEKNAVVSEKKEYITQIVDALNEAFGLNRPPSVYEKDLVNN
ncbi:MAG TPA: DUF6232 family protein [Chryseolinea sp.]|nr:DUF6232 family protein [Chryseolinea sp.]